MRKPEGQQLKRVRGELGDLGWLIRVLVLAATAAAVYRELQLPPAERTWHGRLLGAIPYDFRVPTPRRVIDAYWQPESDRLFNDQPFGVGWAVNLPRLLGLLARLARPSRPTRSRRSRRR